MSLLLALETSGKSGSVALIDRSGDPASVQSMVLPVNIGSGQSLAPAVKALLDRMQAPVTDIGCIALLTGPGSFTGLRVGVATAKAIAYGLGCPVVELDTLDAIYWQCKDAAAARPGWTHCILDAFRGQLFWKRFGTEGELEGAETQAIDVEQFLDELQRLGTSGQHRIAGPGCERLRRFLANEESGESWEKWLVGVEWLEESRFAPQAATIARMGWEKWLRGDFTDPFALVPHYYRGSAAEEKKKKLP